MLVLYTTLGCHLCDKAKSVIYSALGYDHRIEERDIADDDVLMEKYGVKIPVLAWQAQDAQSSHNEELQWPFEAADVREWLERVKAV